MRQFFFIFLFAINGFFVNATELSLTVLDIKGKPVANMVAFATPKSGVQHLPPNEQQLVIDQQGKKFSPYIAVMQQGQQIYFSNKDDITHHIYSVSGANRFDFKLQSGASKTSNPIKASEEIAMGCNIHDWMSGFVLVVDTPFFGKTDKQGKVTFTLPPPDEYTISVWHPQLNTSSHKQEQTLQLNNQNQSLIIKLDTELLPIPKQASQDDFEFLDEY